MAYIIQARGRTPTGKSIEVYVCGSEAGYNDWTALREHARVFATREAAAEIAAHFSRASEIAPA